MNHKPWLLILVVTLVGVTLAALYWLAYVGIYQAFEAIFYPTQPQFVPATTLRFFATIAITLITWIIIRQRNPLWLNGSLILANAAVICITIVLSYYQEVAIYLTIIGFFIILTVYYFFQQRKHWIDYYALAVGLLLGLFYAWPQP